MNKAQKRINQFIRNRRILTTELAARFLADSNLRQLFFCGDVSVGDFIIRHELTVRKSEGGRYVIQKYSSPKGTRITTTKNIRKTAAVINNALSLCGRPYIRDKSDDFPTLHIIRSTEK